MGPSENLLACRVYVAVNFCECEKIGSLMKDRTFSEQEKIVMEAATSPISLFMVLPQEDADARDTEH